MRDTSDTELLRRTDDSYARKLMLSLATALILEALIAIFYLGRLTDQVEQNSSDIAEIQVVFTVISRIDKNLSNLDVKVDYLREAVNSSTVALKGIQSEQDKRSTTMNNMEKHMDSRGKHTQ